MTSPLTGSGWSPTEAVASASVLLGRHLELVGVLPGGQHAMTVRVTDGRTDFVVRGFPTGHDAAHREAEVLPRLTALGDFVPRLVAVDPHVEYPLVITTVVAGGAPDSALPIDVIAREMAAALVRIHKLSGAGLPAAPSNPPTGSSQIARRAQFEWATLDLSDPVLVHSDFWSGNALWKNDKLTGVVDWAGARQGPRGIDLAWCRQDLVLLGSTSAPDLFLAEYERGLGRPIDDIRAWDVQAAASAHERVETWLPNYHGIGRNDLTEAALRSRLDEWNAKL